MKMEPPLSFFPSWCFCFLGVFRVLYFLGLSGCFCLRPGFFSARKVRIFLDVAAEFLGAVEKTKEKKDRDLSFWRFSLVSQSWCIKF